METVNVGSFTPFFIKASMDWVNTFGIPYMQILADGIQGDDVTAFGDTTTGFNVITLNMSDRATGGVDLQENGINCSMRFRGELKTLFIDYRLIMSIYDPSTGIGQTLMPPELLTEANVKRVLASVAPEPTPVIRSGKPKLRIVK